MNFFFKILRNTGVGLFFFLFHVQINADFAYVVNQGSTGDNMSLIDTSTNTLTTNIPAGTTPSQVAITPDGRFAYVTNVSNTANTVTVIEIPTNQIVASIPVGANPFGIAITPDSQFVYVTNQGDGTVSVIDTSSNISIATIATGGNFPNGIAITPDGRFAYVTNLSSGTVSVIDTASRALFIPPISVGSGSNPFGIAITPDGKFAYVTIQNSASVAIIDISTNTKLSTNISVGTAPTGIAITSDGQFAYVTNASSNTVSVIRISNNTLLTTISSGIGNTPIDIAITPDDQYAYVVNNVSSNVSVINLSNNTVLGPNIAVLTSPTGIAISPIPAPQSLTGFQQSNEFGIAYELFNTLQWRTGFGDIAGYVIYRNGVQIATLSPTTTLFEDHNLPKGVTFVYSVASFDSEGFQSAIDTITIP